MSACELWVSPNQRYQPPLCVAVAVDVSLRRLNGAMTGEQLDISQRSTRPVNQPCRSRDECSATGMRGTAIKTDGAIGATEPDHDASCFHLVAPLRQNDRLSTTRVSVEIGQSISEVWVKGDNAAMAHFRGAVSELQRGADATFRVVHHLPGQVRNLSSSKTCFYGEQDDDTVAGWVAGRFGEQEQIVDVVSC